MRVLETDRLVLRHLVLDDAPFILELLNEPGFLRFIGDKGVRDLDGARRYITEGPMASYARNGFGLWLVEAREAGESIGICGLVKRDVLEDADIGYALLARVGGNGYAREAAAAVLRHGLGVLGLPRLLGVVNPDNAASIKVLRRIGLRFERMVRLSEDEPEIELYTSDP